MLAPTICTPSVATLSSKASLSGMSITTAQSSPVSASPLAALKLVPPTPLRTSEARYTRYLPSTTTAEEDALAWATRLGSKFDPPPPPLSVQPVKATAIINVASGVTATGKGLRSGRFMVGYDRLVVCEWQTREGRVFGFLRNSCRAQDPHFGRHTQAPSLT